MTGDCQHNIMSSLACKAGKLPVKYIQKIDIGDSSGIKDRENFILAMNLLELLCIIPNCNDVGGEEPYCCCFICEEIELIAKEIKTLVTC